MDLAAALHELASNPACLSGIPQLLAEATGLATVTFAIVDTTPGHDKRIVHHSTSQGPALPSSTDDPLDLLHLAGGEELPPQCETPLIIRRPVGSRGCLLLICPVADSAAAEILQLAADHLAKVMAINSHCQCEPSQLGEPYVHLTDREWDVLQALNSEEGEKQLADRLGLSPHTLHSHIKAIYRKVGVQGRLQLLQRLQQSLRERRVRLWVRPVGASNRAAG